MVRHAPHIDIASRLEGASQCFMTIVPLAHGEGAVAGLPELFGQGKQVFPIFGIINSVPVSACHEHTATSHADGAAIASGAVVASEAESIGG